MTHTAIRHQPLLDPRTRRLLDSVGSAPHTPPRLGVVAPGGHGKTTVLRALADACRQADVGVLDPRWGLPDATDDVVLLVDDAHQLGDAQLRELRQRVERGRQGVVVACRPWPRPAALAELLEALDLATPLLTLGPLSHDQTAELLGRALDATPSPATVDHVHAQTGGVPRFVRWMAEALADQRRRGDRETTAEPPAGAVARFRHDLDLLDPDVRRLLLAMEAGVGLRMDLLGALLGRAADEVGEVMAAARATGLLAADGTLLPLSRSAVRSLLPAEQRVGVRQRLAELQLARGESVLPLARSLLGSGVGGESVAAAFEAAAGEALPAEPALSAELFAAAAAAGRPVSALAAGWALAAALAGDLDPALRLADQVIGARDSPDRANAACVAAAALAHRGQLGRSAELYRWARTGPSAAFAAVGLIGTGQLAAAEPLLAGNPSDEPPTLLAGAASLTAHGVHESVTGCWTAALSTLVRASSLLEPAGRAVPLPDSPAALAALVAVHCGELDVADSVLARALASGMGGALMATRHRLLQAWILMVRGRTALAAEHLAQIRKDVGSLEPRDGLFAVALDVGLARRGSDLPALRETWAHAREAVLRHPVDLFTFLPLGELAVAAARLGDQDRVVPHLREATALARRLGDPPLWVTPLHWAGLHAALVADQQDVAEEHAAALAANGHHNRFCAVLAHAAECWLAVSSGTIDPTRTAAAARGLRDAGLCWDGARLAGQAAIRTSDRKAMVGLLECARLLQGRPGGSRAGASTGGSAPHRSGAGRVPGGQLSEREREVASLVLSGLTYKQVADRLFISAKTVEHHMARIRHRLGCANRGELLTQLRHLLQRADSPS
ncbi:regulatory protein, luxR family [Streptoalloteichus tenebrarius]|uniref:Regulatory protein, luxR family n=1 Tax=Streptoalloteichus tenebrarius (strain ATCC 17920 / DSM 40477 / JCM 4838 / CBS 697.72 / NBRC 16177 / NCIMB 11028 / NRRL B-12390 / A12253. 1 / ISP 5477) TaxID=1933 RepID=A0ABT1I3R5_STRSD|nr:LuxR family transcriptional regulator [Streptoalloteichus tenebrarius]MCP2262432.1 regulatory protein, luxR family [Streptoalloteichus tenebrarius]BFF00791.1 helix-turn-helix transcriptional regulator [Streptoalloteichus tenebrarius]